MTFIDFSFDYDGRETFEVVIDRAILHQMAA
jgi:hypothetical protein